MRIDPRSIDLEDEDELDNLSKELGGFERFKPKKDKKEEEVERKKNSARARHDEEARRRKEYDEDAE